MKKIVFLFALLIALPQIAQPFELKAAEVKIKDAVMSDSAIPLEVKAIVRDEFDRHVSKEDRLYHDGITPSVFTLSNKSVYMIFELNSDTDEAVLAMLVRIHAETGFIDFLWAREVGMELVEVKN